MFFHVFSPNNESLAKLLPSAVFRAPVPLLQPGLLLEVAVRRVIASNCVPVVPIWLHVRADVGGAVRKRLPPADESRGAVEGGRARHVVRLDTLGTLSKYFVFQLFFCPHQFPIKPVRHPSPCTGRWRMRGPSLLATPPPPARPPWLCRRRRHRHRLRRIRPGDGQSGRGSQTSRGGRRTRP